MSCVRDGAVRLSELSKIWPKMKTQSCFCLDAWTDVKAPQVFSTGVWDAGCFVGAVGGG